MIISKKINIKAQININNSPQEICYLDSNINNSWNHSYEIKSQRVFINIKKMPCSISLNINMLLKLLSCYIFSLLYYWVGSWSLTEKTLSTFRSRKCPYYKQMISLTIHLFPIFFPGNLCTITDMHGKMSCPVKRLQGQVCKVMDS